MSQKALGIDIGGTGIKGAVVDITTGEFVTSKIKYKTPENSTPPAVLAIIKQIINDFEWADKPIAFGFPAIVKNGVSLSAANIHKDWINFDIVSYLSKELNVNNVSVVNDADAAGLAELTFGAAKGKMGSVLLLTLGTGIGSAFMVDGNLVPNTELGHLKWKDSITEDYASNRAKKEKKLDWPEFGEELSAVLKHIELLLSPDCIIIGGGISKSFDEYGPLLDTKAEVIPAQLKNNAGIIGAAYYNHLNK